MKITNRQKILQRAYTLFEDKGQWFFLYKKHFPDMPYGSSRNNISELEKEGRVKWIGYYKYALVDCMPSQEYKQRLMNRIQLLENNIEVLQGNVVTDVKNNVTLLTPNSDNIHLNTLNAIRTCLQSALWDEDNNIHDLTLTTSIPKFYKYLKLEGHRIDPTNYGIDLTRPKQTDNDLSLKAFVYNTDTIEIFISNSNNPIMVNVEDIKRLRNTLEQFRFYLGQYTNNIPKLDDGFKVVKYDYARDGILPIPVSLTYNFYNFENELMQIYTKRSNSFFTEFRYEKRDIHPNEQFFGEYERQLLGNCPKSNSIPQSERSTQQMNGNVQLNIERIK